MISQEQKTSRKIKRTKYLSIKYLTLTLHLNTFFQNKTRSSKCFDSFSAIRVITKTQLNFKPKSLTAEVAAGEVE